ncbi:MAG: hypothetical protein IJL91_09225, partial [Bacteroidales bacterium]|nr:hypothetical protein [Bacteroidales bacterium]
DGEEKSIGDYQRFQLDIPPLPDPKGFVLPPAEEGSAAFLLMGKYDSSVEWKVDDVVPIELTIINAGANEVHGILLTGSRNTLNKGMLWQETIYEGQPEDVLLPGESLTFTYNYTVKELELDLKECGSPFLYFEAAGSTVRDMYLCAGYAMPDPLYPSSILTGSASILLNGVCTRPDTMAEGEKIHFDMHVYNVGEAELEGLQLFCMGRCEDGYWFVDTPEMEGFGYLPVGGEYKTSFDFELTKDFLDYPELHFDVWAIAEVPASFVTAGGLDKTIRSTWSTTVPVKESEVKENDAVMTLTAECDPPALPLTVGQVIPVKFHLETSHPVHEGLELFVQPFYLRYDDTHDFYEKIPKGIFEPGEGIDFTYNMVVQPEDVEKGRFMRGFNVKGFYQLEGGSLIPVYSNILEIEFADGFPETKADVKPVLAIEQVSEKKPYYEEGDEITLRWTLRNDGEVSGYFGGIFLCEDITEDPEQGIMYIRTEMVEGAGYPINPGVTGTTADNFTFTVPANTTGDVMMTFLFDSLLVTWEPDLEEHRSNMVPFTIPVLKGDGSEPFVTQKEISHPKNDKFYTEGETVEFEFRIYNLTDQTFQNAAFLDTLDDASVLGSDVLAPTGDTPIVIIGSHEIPKEFCDWGSFPMQGFLHYEDAAGEQRYFITVADHVPCGYDSDEDDDWDITIPAWPLPKIPKISVYKTEVSSPKNGEYYTEGETIEYLIQVYNNSDDMVPEVIVYDVQNNKERKEFASIEIFYGMGYREYKWEYKVTAEDVERGYVTNRADVDWITE